MKHETENTLFPGRPNYTGPITGVFGLLHHQVLVERSHNVMERVAYVMQYKPKHEVAIRLHNMIYLGGCQAAVDYEAKLDALYADRRAKLNALAADRRVNRDAFDANYWAKLDAIDAERYAKVATLDAEILTYIRTHIPDCAWDSETLVFDVVQS